MINELTKSTQTFLNITDTTTLDEWSSVGRQLYQAADRMTWAMADWAEFGDRKYNALQSFCEAHGLSYSTIKQAAAVARLVPREVRKPDQLLFGHHFEVSMLPEKQQAKWLDKAEKDKLSPLELRKLIRDSQGEMSLVSDGKPLKLATGEYRHMVSLFSFLQSQPDDFWTPSNREFWRKKISPYVEWFQAKLAS